MKLFHRHEWLNYGVQYGRWSLSRTPGTLVLQRCWCGETRTETLVGHWTDEELGITEEDAR